MTYLIDLLQYCKRNRVAVDPAMDDVTSWLILRLRGMLIIIMIIALMKSYLIQTLSRYLWAISG